MNTAAIAILICVALLLAMASMDATLLKDHEQISSIFRIFTMSYGAFAGAISCMFGPNPVWWVVGLWAACGVLAARIALSVTSGLIDLAEAIESYRAYEGPKRLFSTSKKK